MKPIRSVAVGFVVVGLALSPVMAGGAYAADKARTEQTVSMDQLPAPVKATLEKEAKGGTIGQVTQDTAKGKTFYEAAIEKDGKQRFVHVSPEGKVLKRESAKTEAKEQAKENK